MYPLKLKPTLKDYIWGGTKLITDFSKKTNFSKVAESWELACHKDGSSVISNGPLEGISFKDYIEKFGLEVMGKNCQRFSEFPVLIKLIDAKDNLSIQVHPQDEYAMRTANQFGKTEMWYILDCEPDAFIIFGFNSTITTKEFDMHIKCDTLLDVLNKVYVKKGDVFFIKSGTVHAIGKGILIAEIQQNSNLTYRVYDYNRLGADNKPRETHVKQALEVASLTKPCASDFTHVKKIVNDTFAKTLLRKCEYFTVYDLQINVCATLEVSALSFHSIVVLSGNLMLLSEHGDISLKKGDSVFLPASYGEYRLLGQAWAILTTIE
ncbi:MAG: type I phosphomannose isomerase catalytic subunit [Oscillospiraceae bacterium]